MCQPGINQKRVRGGEENCKDILEAIACSSVLGCKCGSHLSLEVLVESDDCHEFLRVVWLCSQGLPTSDDLQPSINNHKVTKAIASNDSSNDSQEATRNKCIASSNKCLTGSNKDASRNKCIASSNKCLTSSNKKLLARALLVVTRTLVVIIEEQLGTPLVTDPPSVASWKGSLQSPKHVDDSNGSAYNPIGRCNAMKSTENSDVP